MPTSPYQHMQAAVDIVADSPHPANKIAATISGQDNQGQDFAISRVNHWPDVIAEKIGKEPNIGNASGTIHAETACIFAAPKTEAASIFITDPPCPNCMKNMAEAGIKALYIDHKGFDKDWASRRGDSFENMSMRIAEKAGIDVYVIYRKEQRFEIISRHAQGYEPPIENPPIIKPATDDFKSLIQSAKETMGDEPFALAIAKDYKGQEFYILDNRHPSIGYTSETLEEKKDKYSFIMQPINRVLMIAARHGLTIDPQHLYSSRVPTARELVNLIGGGFTQIYIGNTKTARDNFGPLALKQLTDAEILNVKNQS